MWDARQQRVEELDSDDDTDSQGVGLASSAGNTRFASDPLRFTGTNLGGSDSLRARRSYHYPQEDDDDDYTSEDDDSEQDSDLDDGAGGDDQVQLAMRDKEEALVETALARIRRAQAKGKKDVKLSKGELTALERRRERLNAENRKKRKEKEQRIAVPISQLEPASLERRPAAPDNTAPNQAVPGAFGVDQEHTNYPPMGYFPPPLTSRSRPRSGTSASQRPPSRDPNAEPSRGSSPFEYSYVQHPNYPPSARNTSDPMARHRAGGPFPQEGDWAPGSRPASRHSQAGLDPFVYMTGGSRMSYHGGPPPPRRHRSGSAADMGTRMYGPGPGAFPREATPTPTQASGRGSRRESPEETSGETTSESDSDNEPSPRDGRSQGASIAVGGAATRSKRGRGRNGVIVVEDSPEPEAEPEPRRQKEPERERSSQRATKKSSTATSPAKRKPVASSRRRKGK